MQHENLAGIQKIKQSIENLVNSGNATEAKEILKKYKGIFLEDSSWLCATNAVICILENDYEEAKKQLQHGLESSPFNANLLFNLGYVYEQLGEHQLAYDYYIDAEYALNQNEKKIAKEALRNIQQLDQKVIKKKAIAFIVKPGMDSFLEDLIKGFKGEYRVKKVVVKETSQIEQAMKWSDVSWFEWCDELIIYASKTNLASTRKIICRLHSYEAFTNSIHAVKWTAVDKVIFVAEHIREIVGKQVRINEQRMEIVANGINEEKFKYATRKKGYNIAYVGYINYKKGPMLLLQVIKALVDKDSRFQLHIAGQFQDIRDQLYFQQMIQEWKLQKNINFHGWQDDIDKWLEDKEFLISTSLLESQQLSIMEAMAKGIKPVIHNFYGAKNIYPSQYVWSTINEAVEMILENEYDSNEYRGFVQRRYSANDMNNRLLKLIREVVENEN
ncbi:glycosyltransferase [Brevibacillus panacihumi]|uniref:glycosyltransferase n=1 Tax=Brevibacillus panacihumi TaxID=497735 RepID=UPI00040F43CC|nr:glycosyltransferase [Brevibacillus panacihumi]